MTHHFIWGFQFTETAIGQWPPLLSANDSNKWESRYFWNDNQLVSLTGLPLTLLSLTHYKIKSRHDSYIVINDTNIKLRKQKIHVKPLIEKENDSFCYAKKREIPLHDADEIATIIPEIKQWNGQQDIEEFLSEHYSVFIVDKDVLIHQINDTTRLEFSRIRVNSHFYCSLSIETRSRQDLEKLVKLIIPQQKAQSYTEFLNNL